MPARPRRRVGGRPLYPTALERAYTRRLLRRCRAANDLLGERMERELARVGAEIDRLAAARSDAMCDASSRRDNASLIARIIAAVRATARVFEVTFEPQPEDLSRFAVGVDRFTSQQVTRSVQQVAAIPVRPHLPARALDLWARDNVSLIKSIDARYFADIEKAVIEALEQGRTTKQLTAELRQRYGVSQGRARLIARDQLGKLNGEITRQRQTDLGVRSYRWSTSGDERVRPLHRDLDGKVFPWDAPHPTEGHPGQAVQCRCVAEPVFEDELDDG